MRVVFLLGTVSRNAMEAGECISDADLAALDHISEKAGVEADVVLACEDRKTWGKSGSKVPLKLIRPERDRAIAEVLAHKAEMVVAFGKTAAQCLFDKGVKVGDLRHRLHTIEGLPPVWVTYSLEEAAMAPGLVKFMGIDLLHAAKGETEVRLRPTRIDRKWNVDPDPRLDLNAPHGSVDLETYPGTDPHAEGARIRMVVVSTSRDFAQVIYTGPNGELPEWLQDWLESGRTLWGGSNIQFDMEWLRIHAGVRLVNYVCTSHLQHILDENNSSKNLKHLILMYTNIGDYSRKQRDRVMEAGGDWGKVPDEDFEDYAGADGYGGFEVLDKQLALIKARGLERALELHKRTYPALARVQYNGAVLDMEENARLQEAYDKELTRLAADARKTLGPINLNSPKQLVPALHEKVPSIRLTEWFWKNMDNEEEKYSTKRAVLEREAHKHAVVATVLEYRRRETLRRFIAGVHKHIEPRRGVPYVVSSIRGDVTVTHRLSSSKPNLQNLPRDVAEEVALMLNPKRQYVSRFPGGSIVEADQSQLELRVAAHVSSDIAMLEAFLRGTDVHTELAAMMRRCKTTDVTKEMRQAGKTTNFHVLYGGKAFGLSLRLGCGKAEAEELIAQFYDTFRGFAAWQKDQEAFAKKHLYVESMFGRRRHFVRPVSWKSPEGRRILRQAVNAPIQGDASGITNVGLAQVVARIEREGLRSVPFLTVHDSGIVDRYPGEEETVNRIMVEEMEHPNLEPWGIKLQLPLKVDLKAGATWGSMEEFEFTQA